MIAFHRICSGGHRRNKMHYEARIFVAKIIDDVTLDAQQNCRQRQGVLTVHRKPGLAAPACEPASKRRSHARKAKAGLASRRPTPWPAN